MISSPGRGKHTPLYVTAGWLFAELLLGIALVFLISSPGAQPTPAATPTPTLFVSPTPTPKVAPPLELQPFTLPVTGIDVNGLVKNNPTAVNDFQDAIMKQVKGKQLNGQPLVALCAGLVIPYGGDPAASDQIGKAMTRALKSLGTNSAKQGQFFKLTAYHAPLVWLDQPYGTVKLEVYVYTGATPCQSTSNG